MDREGRKGYLHAEGSALRHCYYRILGFREMAEETHGEKQQMYERYHRDLEEKYKAARKKLNEMKEKVDVDEEAWRKLKKDIRATIGHLEHEVTNATVELEA